MSDRLLQAAAIWPSPSSDDGAADDDRVQHGCYLYVGGNTRVPAHRRRNILEAAAAADRDDSQDDKQRMGLTGSGRHHLLLRSK
jgi:hypothetical protein